MSEKILVLTPTNEAGALPAHTPEVLTLARALAKGPGPCELFGGVFGKNAAGAAGSLAGLSKVFTAESPELEASRYASDAAAMETLARASKATLILLPSSARANRVAAALAHRLSGKVDTRVSEITTEGGAIAARRWFYRQRIIAKFTRSERPWILVVEPGSSAAETAAGPAPVPEAVTVFVQSRTRVEGYQIPAQSAQTLRPDAKLLFVAGAGWCKKQADGKVRVKDAEGIIRRFLELSGASLGGSKSMVDQSGEGAETLASLMTHLNQVGQTGSTPRHAKGLATACHGEEPHTVGWRFVGERRAVNLDPNCGWARGKADVLYVADAFSVMEKVNRLLG